MKENNYTYDHILVRFGELSTKGKNKKDFIKQLLKNMKNALRDYKEIEYVKTHDRIYIILNNADHIGICEDLKKVFGISSFSLAIKIDTNIDLICKTALELVQQGEYSTFKINTRRHYKQFEMNSDTINRTVAKEVLINTDLKVNVRTPDIKVDIEVREYETYIMSGKIKGAGGYPVGIGGKALVMLSGGIDSPVAAYLTNKRGISVECIHYASPPYTSEKAQQKVLDLAKKISKSQGHVRVHIVPFTQMQLEIYKHCDESYAITIMRRMMYRLAQSIAEKSNCKAIVNGESIGQVASQTLESMNVINSTITMPVIRPVACLDKLEIIDIAKFIDTYEISIQPFEDCCTIFTPKNPVTRPTLKKCENFERRFDFETLLEDTINKTESINVYPNSFENEDIF